MKRIFEREAAKYWSKQLSVIPVKPGTKEPAIKGWTGYCNNLPPNEKQREWIENYADFGIGLCLGSTTVLGSRIAAVDVDDDRWVKAVQVILGDCPCSKRGKKGTTFFVRVPSESKLKSSKISNSKKIGIVDFLFSGRFTVLPPSVHPQTALPYQWEGPSLLETDLDALPICDASTVALMKAVIGTEYSEVIIGGADTHEDGLRLVAFLVQRGCDDRTIQNLFASLLPRDYSGNSLDELPEWISSARAKGFDDTAKGARGSAAERLVELVHAAGVSLFHDEGRRGFMSVPTSEGGQRNIALRSSDATLWLTKLLYDSEGKALGRNSLDEATSLLEAKARFAAPMCRTSLRIGGDDKRVFVDLGHEDGSCVAITASGWSVEKKIEGAKLVRSAGFSALPVPARNGNLEDLKRLLNLSDEDWILVLAFLLACLRPGGPYMLMLVEGEQGSGKSFLCRTLKFVIDPNQVEKARLPTTDRDLMIHAKDYFLLSFDNVSGMKSDMSDALCVLTTGGGFATRKLYSDDELFVLNFTRPIILNGISEFANRADLLERAIPLHLPALRQGTRKSEEEMLAEFNRILPGILGRLYDIIAGALSSVATTPTPTALRMADAARWLVACEPHTGLPPETFMTIIAGAQNQEFIERVQNDFIFCGLERLVRDAPFEGTMLDLYDALKPVDWKVGQQFPADPARLSKHLARQKPSMARAGLHFELLAKTRVGRRIRVWIDGQENMPAQEKTIFPRM